MMGQDGSGRLPHTPASSSKPFDPAAIAYARPSNAGCSIGGRGARSITAVSTPATARRQARVPPTGPAPMMQTSTEITPRSCARTRARSNRFGWLDLPFDLRTKIAGRHGKIILRLTRQPERRAGAEETPKPQRRLRADRTLPANNVADPVARHPKLQSQRMSGYAAGFELAGKCTAGMHGRKGNPVRMFINSR